MSVMPAYFLLTAIMLASVGQLPAEVGATYDRIQSPAGRDITILTALIPADMSATLLMPNLSKIGHHIVSTKLFGQQHKDPYRSLKASLEIVDGIDDAGAGAIGIMGDTTSAEIWQNMALWLPATNPTAMMTFMQPIQISAGIYRVTIAGHPSFAAEHGDYLLLSPKLEIIHACLNSHEPIRQRLSAHQQRMLSEADLTLVVSSAKPPISGGSDTENQVDWLAAWPVLSALQHAMSPSVSSPQVPMCSLSIKPNGLDMAMVGHSRPDVRADRAGRMISQSTMVRDNDLLLALPSESIIAAMGFEPGTAMLASSGFVDLLMGYMQQYTFADAQVVNELSRRMRRSISRASVGSIAIQSPTDDSHTFSATLILQTKTDAAIIRAEFQSMLIQLKRGFFLDPVWQSHADRLQIIPAASSFQGVQIDHISADGMNTNKSVGTSFAGNFISTDGILARMAVIDDSAFVLIIGGNEQGIHDVITRWRTHQTPLSSSSTIVSYAATRHAPVSSEGYISSSAMQQLAGFTGSKTKNGGGAIDIVESSWATFSSFNVEVGVERFNMFLPYGWVELIMQQSDTQN